MILFCLESLLGEDLDFKYSGNGIFRTRSDGRTVLYVKPYVLLEMKFYAF